MVLPRHYLHVTSCLQLARGTPACHSNACLSCEKFVFSTCLFPKCLLLCSLFATSIRQHLAATWQQEVEELCAMRRAAPSDVSGFALLISLPQDSQYLHSLHQRICLLSKSFAKATKREQNRRLKTASQRTPRKQCHTMPLVQPCCNSCLVRGKKTQLCVCLLLMIPRASRLLHCCRLCTLC